MKARQLYFVLLGCCVLALAALLGTAYGADQVLSRQAGKLSSLRADNDAATLQQAALTRDRQDIRKYSELNTIAASVVPQDKDQAEAVRQIVNIAGASGIPKLTSITFPSSTLGTSGSSSRLTQLTPVTGISGVYNLQITISLSGSGNSVPYDNFLQFLTGLEQNRRTAQVASITVSPDSKHPGNVSFTLVVNEFIKP